MERKLGSTQQLFAAENEDIAIITLISVAMVLTALWSFLANYLVKHGFLADIFRRIGDRILPYMLIVLGLYILTEAYLLV